MAPNPSLNAVEQVSAKAWAEAPEGAARTITRFSKRHRTVIASTVAKTSLKRGVISVTLTTRDGDFDFRFVCLPACSVPVADSFSVIAWPLSYPVAPPLFAGFAVVNWFALRRNCLCCKDPGYSLLYFSRTSCLNVNLMIGMSHNYCMLTRSVKNRGDHTSDGSRRKEYARKCYG